MSTTANSITVAGKEYQLKFGMKMQFNVMDHFNIEKLSDYQKLLKRLTTPTTKSDFEVFGVFIVSAIKASYKEDIDLDFYDVLDEVTVNPNFINSFLEAFVNSQPKQESQNAVGKGKK